jgi:hypothetical protein
MSDKYATSYPGHEKRKTTPVHDNLQMSLVNANEEMVKDLLVNTYPPLYLDLIRQDMSQKKSMFIDEKMYYHSSYSTEDSKWYRCDSLSECFSVESYKIEAEKLLKRPKSRTLYADIYLILKYNFHAKYNLKEEHPYRETLEGRTDDVVRDFISGTIRINSRPIEIVVEIKSEVQSSGDTLRQIKTYKDYSRTEYAILVCDTLTGIEIESFKEGRCYIYSPTRLITPIKADCGICINDKCPMYGKYSLKESPVIMCSSFDTY